MFFLNEGVTSRKERNPEPGGDLQPTEAMELAKSKSSDMGGVENHFPSLNSIELSVIGLLGRTLTGLGLCAH